MSESNLSLGLTPQTSPFLYGSAEQVAFYLGYGHQTLEELPLTKARLLRSNN